MYIVMEKKVQSGECWKDDFTLKPFKSLVDAADYINKGSVGSGGDLYEVRLYELQEDKIFESKFCTRKENRL